MLNGDTAVMLLFDTNGKIAGIQNGVRKLRALLTTPTLVPNLSFLFFFFNIEVIISNQQ